MSAYPLESESDQVGSETAVRRYFPVFPEGSWWPLRDRFKQSMPAAVTVDYLASVLGVEGKTARNLLATLKGLGLLDRDGAPTERANRWRVDAEYPRVCGEMLRELYPASYAVEIPDPSTDLRDAVAWFMRAAGVGEPAARRMARFHGLLRERAPRRGHDPLHAAATSRHAERAPLPSAVPSSSPATEATQAPVQERPRPRVEIAPSELRIGLAADPLPSGSGASAEDHDAPTPRLDFHLHISPEMTERQIDAVFRSMATHLFGRPRA